MNCFFIYFIDYDTLPISPLIYVLKHTIKTYPMNMIQYIAKFSLTPFKQKISEMTMLAFHTCFNPKMETEHYEV